MWTRLRLFSTGSRWYEAPMTPEQMFPLVFVLALIVARWVWQRAQGKGTHLGREPDARSWRFAAEELGLQYRAGTRSASLSGDLEDVRVYADAEWSPADGGHRGRSMVWRPAVTNWEVTTRFRAILPPGMPRGLRLREQTALSALVESLRSDGEIVLGDAAFDRAFLVQGDDPEAVARALTPAARAGLLVLATRGILTMNERELTLAVPELADGDRLNLLIGAMAGVARVLG